MLPSPSSSPRPALSNRTNVYRDTPSTPVLRNSVFFLPTPPERLKAKRQSITAAGGTKKRLKISFETEESDDSTECESDSDVDMEDVMNVEARWRKNTMLHLMNSTIMAGTSRGHKRPELSTRPILQSFVSSHKSDVFKCYSSEADSYMTPPYACSYTHAAKAGGTPLLAVSTEQGSVHILNTSKRSDWDCEPSRVTYQPHSNGIFDVKWNPPDTLLATSSGDQTTHISCPETMKTISVLRGHTSTVKCVAWNLNHGDLLSTGGRDGAICIWDLRVSEGRDDMSNALSPVLVIPGAHEDVAARGKLKPRGRKGRSVPMAKSVTSLLYPDNNPYALISSGASDGILHSWDLRLPTGTKKSKSTKSKPLLPTFSSSLDPTTLHGSRRPRGITSLTAGTGPTAGLLFALGIDSRIHTYSTLSLAAQATEYTHQHMQTNNFYVRLSMSPCGRWLANGGTAPEGSVFLFDASNAARPARTSSRWESGVQLKAQLGDVGAVDWAEGMLASCSDDGMVRIWRPDVDEYRNCVTHPDEKQWEHSWAIGEH